MKRLEAQDLKFRPLGSVSSGERYSDSCVISDALKSRDLFISIEILEPGHRASAPHIHSESEEIVHILDGQVLAVEGEEVLPLEPGDSALFSAGDAQPHFIQNSGKIPARFLLIRKRRDSDQVAYGPPDPATRP